MSFLLGWPIFNCELFNFAGVISRIQHLKFAAFFFGDFWASNVASYQLEQEREQQQQQQQQQQQSSP